MKCTVCSDTMAIRIAFSHRGVYVAIGSHNSDIGTGINCIVVAMANRETGQVAFVFPQAFDIPNHLSAHVTNIPKSGELRVVHGC